MTQPEPIRACIATGCKGRIALVIREDETNPHFLPKFPHRLIGCDSTSARQRFLCSSVLQCSQQCAVCSQQCTVCSVQRAVCSAFSSG